MGDVTETIAIAKGKYEMRGYLSIPRPRETEKETKTKREKKEKKNVVPRRYIRSCVRGDMFIVHQRSAIHRQTIIHFPSPTTHPTGVQLSAIATTLLERWTGFDLGRSRHDTAVRREMRRLFIRILV